MKIALSLEITFLVIVLLLIKKLKPYRGKILFFYGLAVAGLFAFYNFKTAGLILPFYRPKNQMFYQSEFLEDGLYTDALLPYLLKGKTVHMYDYDVDENGDYNSFDAWVNGQIMVRDMANIMEEFGAKTDIMSQAPKILSRSQTEAMCENVGYLNDTFRYSYFYNDLDSEYGNGFYYYWFYSVSKPPFCLYIDRENIDEAEDLYFLTDEEGNMILMSSDVYEREEENFEYMGY